MSSAQITLDCEHLAHEITRLSGHINAANYRLLSLIAEFDQRSGWSGTGIRSCAHWLSWKCGLDIGAAREKVRVAHALEGLPKIGAAFASGKISYSIVRALTRVATPETDEYYVYLSRWGTASQLERLVRNHRRVQRTQAQDRDQLQQEDRSLCCVLDADGMWNIKAKLPPEQGEQLYKLLYGLADTEDSPGENTSLPQKRADALSTVAEHYLATASEDTVEPLKGAERYQVMLHVDIDTLQEKSNNARLGRENWIHPSVAKRISCDASLVTVLKDSSGKVLNIGRRSRIIPPSIKRALDVRDGACRYPGCCQTRFVDAHHIEHWADGGETSLNNLVTLCRHHHRALHQGDYRVDGDFNFFDRHGNLIEPTAEHLFPDQDVAVKVLAIEQVRPDISAETCVTQWQGEAMDMHLAVLNLVLKENSAPMSAN